MAWRSRTIYGGVAYTHTGISNGLLTTVVSNGMPRGGCKTESKVASVARFEMQVLPAKVVVTDDA